MKKFRECPAEKEKVVCELPLISAHHRRHSWWIKGAGLVQMDSGGLAAHGEPQVEVGQL